MIVTIKCKQCGCTRDIEEKQIPRGDCNYCLYNFGWLLSPEDIDENIFPLIKGDIVVVNTELNYTHQDRIFSIERNNKFIYKNKRELILHINA